MMLMNRHFTLGNQCQATDWHLIPKSNCNWVQDLACFPVCCWTQFDPVTHSVQMHHLTKTIVTVTATKTAVSSQASPPP
eukprot:10600183-Ditylum_brightwellii.AAC.1